MEGELPKISILLRDEDGVSCRGGDILDVGSSSDCMYAVRKGEVDIWINDQRIETLEPGHVLGELGLIDDSQRSARAIARSDCEVVPVDRPRFLFLVQQTPGFALQIMEILDHRLRRGSPHV